MTKTANRNHTIMLEGNLDSGTLERVYPCRCGETHTGEYAIYDWGHHNCFHDSPLVVIDAPDYLMCPDCGKVFWLENSDAK